MDKSPFSITIDRQVIKLLGAHLYGDTPSVVNELVANAYDAGAKRIWITVKTSHPYQISVQDDGIGMSLSDINNYYLKIGYNRRAQEELRKELTANGIDRPDMGQKGIGKLAVFALSKQVRLISIKNNIPTGCFMDFDTICQAEGQPQPFDAKQEQYNIRKDCLSEKGSGTLILLENVVKDLSKSYKFIVSSIARSFILNNEDVKVFIKKDDEDFQEIKRGRLDYCKHIDVMATIGDRFTDLVDRVKRNEIEGKYKRIIKYEDLVEETKSLSLKKQFDALPKKIKVFNKEKSRQVDFDFKFDGWIGTVKNEESFKKLLADDGYSEEDIKDKDIIVVDDNRISIYSRGKVGEYNILPKLKTKAANDAYIIGEIFVDDFEDDSLLDMATSNRRGYQEDDSRYETLCRNLKLLVSRIVSTKQIVNRQRKADEDAAEAEKIKATFQSGHIKSKGVFDKMTAEDKNAIEEDHTQFSRAVSLEYQDSKPNRLLISHRQADLRPYGDFIINVLLKINPTLSTRIVFTSNPNFGLNKGRNVFDELKQCFRPDYYILFLFTKSFYDSNACLAEAGAAWATNRKYMNIVVDIDFHDIDKPLDNGINGARFRLDTDDNIVQFAQVLQTVLEAIDKKYDLAQIKTAILEEVATGKYRFNLPEYIPYRKHQLYPICNKCGRLTTPQLNNITNEIEYICECGQATNLKAKVK
jgi:hypothetical protein